MRLKQWIGRPLRAVAIILASALMGALLISAAIVYPMVLLSSDLRAYEIAISPSFESFVATVRSSFLPVATFSLVGAILLLLAFRLRGDYRHVLIAGTVLGAAMLAPVSLALPSLGWALAMGAGSGLITALCWIAIHKLIT